MLDSPTVPQPATSLHACHSCGLVHELPELAPNQHARCSWCRSAFRYLRPEDYARSKKQTASFAFAALMLYPFAISLPFVTVSQLGQSASTSIVESSINLMQNGEYVVGLVIIICSIVLPFFKLSALLLLSTTSGWLRTDHAARTWRFIEHAGRWGMIDVMLAAVMIAMLKVKDLVTIEVDLGLFAFSSCVLLSLAASASFNLGALWNSK